MSVLVDWLKFIGTLCLSVLIAYLIILGIATVAASNPPFSRNGAAAASWSATPSVTPRPY